MIRANDGNLFTTTPIKYVKRRKRHPTPPVVPASTAKLSYFKYSSSNQFIISIVALFRCSVTFPYLVHSTYM